MQGGYNLFNPYVHLGQILAKGDTKIRRGRGPARVAIHTGVSFRRPLRRCAALVAAYAVVLQAMLAAFALPTAHAGGAAAFEICRSDRADAPAQALPHEACVACLAGHCGATGPARTATAEAWPVIDRPDAVGSPPDAAPARVARARRQAPRAPPRG